MINVEDNRMVEVGRDRVVKQCAAHIQQLTRVVMGAAVHQLRSD